MTAERKMASVKIVDAINPHDNADRLEIAKIGGWNVVVGKGTFAAGDVAVYFEIDSFLRGDDPRFEQFLTRGQKNYIIDGQDVAGHVLKTVKLRGVISQGLLMTGEELGVDITANDVCTDLTEALGVVKYDVEKPKTAEIIGSFDTRWAPKTDAERVQNLVDHWDEIKALNWEATVKVDGTSQTLFYDSEEERVRVFGRNWELDPETSDGLMIAEQNGIADYAKENPYVVIQAELAGPGVNGNRAKLSARRLFVFAVWNDGVKIPRADWDERLLSNAAPVADITLNDYESVEDLIGHVNGLRGMVTKDIMDEGVVFHLNGVDAQGNPVWMDRNANFKVINNKFLSKHGL